MGFFDLFRRSVSNEKRPDSAPQQKPTSLAEYANSIIVSGDAIYRDAASSWSAVQRSVNIISGSAAGLITDSVRIVDRDRREIKNAEATRYIDLLRNTPDGEIDAYSFLIDAFADMALSGNAVLLIDRSMTGRQRINLCQPNYTQITFDEGQYHFRVRPDREYEFGMDRVASLSEIAIGRNPKIGGRVYTSTPRERFMAEPPVSRLSKMILLALNSESFVNEYFDRKSGSVRADMAITFEQVLDDETQKNFRKYIEQFMTGRAPLLLTGGPQIHNLKTSASDSQTDQLRRFSIGECSRAFGVPEVFLSQSSGNVWGSSLSLLQQSLYRFTIKPYISQLLESLSFRMLPTNWRYDVDLGRVNVGDLELIAKVLPHIQPSSGKPTALLSRSEGRSLLGIETEFVNDWPKPEELMPGLKQAENDADGTA